jgi:hypothetical protein
VKGIYGERFAIQIMVDHSCGHDRQREDGLNVHNMNVSYGGTQKVMHESKLSKTCLGEYTSGGYPIMKENDTQHMVFRQGDVGPYDMPLDEREVLRNGDVKGKKWVNKGYKEIWTELWPKVEEALPDGDTGTVTIMNQLLYYDCKKKTLRSKDDKDITHSKAISLCLKYNVQLTRQELKKKVMKELVAIIIGIGGNAHSTTLTVSSNTYFINKDDLRLTTRDNPISMDMLRYLCRQNGVSWRKEIPDTYKVENKPKTTDDLLSDLKTNNIDAPTHFVKKNLIDLATKHGIPVNKTVEKGVAKTWLDQPKGMLQVAWERGLLDFDSYCVEDFSVKGKLDEMGNRIAATNLSLLISGCKDFLTEESFCS